MQIFLHRPRFYFYIYLSIIIIILVHSIYFQFSFHDKVFSFPVLRCPNQIFIFLFDSRLSHIKLINRQYFSSSSSFLLDMLQFSTFKSEIRLLSFPVPCCIWPSRHKLLSKERNLLKKPLFVCYICYIILNMLLLPY